MDNKHTILAYEMCTPEQRKQLEVSAAGCEIRYETFNGISKELIETADIILGNPPRDLLQHAKNLKWLQLSSAGADGYYQPGTLPEGCILTNATGSYGLAISEYMIGTVLMLMRNFHLYRDNQRSSEWKSEGAVSSVYGSKILIVGLGDIGNEFAKIVKAMGGYTIGVKRNQSAKPEYIDEQYTVDKLDSLLPLADVVALSLPGNHETYRLINRDRLALLKKDSLLINVGRGTAVDLDALCESLTEGRLRGAALDVTDPEPLPGDHPAWKVKNLVITPHVAGGFYLPETFQRFINIAAANLKAFLHNEPMTNVVDGETGYRKFERS